jgi:putative endonuclease
VEAKSNKPGASLLDGWESIPLPPVFARVARGERRLPRRSFSEGGRVLPCDVNAASYDSASQRMSKFFFVYILHSEIDRERFYTGLPGDLCERLKAHSSGRVHHSAKWKPWHLKTFIAFSDRSRAVEFERYLKSSSGRAFAKKRL